MKIKPEEVKRLTGEFKAAVKKIRTLKKTPSNEELLEIYALYKQATVGDNKNERPGMMSFRAQRKHDAWKSKEGMNIMIAMKEYVEIVDKVFSKCSE